MKVIHTPLGRVEQLSENLLKTTILVNKIDRVEDMQQHIELIHQAFGHEVYYLSDSRLVRTASKEVRRYLADHANILAAAILINSHVTAMLANIFIAFSKPTYPNKIFNHEADAMAWLVEQGAIAPKN